MIESNGNAVFFDDGEGGGESVLNSVVMLGCSNVKHGSPVPEVTASGV